MGAIDIPPSPSAGRCSARLELDTVELHSIKVILQQALQLLQAGPPPTHARASTDLAAAQAQPVSADLLTRESAPNSAAYESAAQASPVRPAASHASQQFSSELAHSSQGQNQTILRDAQGAQPVLAEARPPEQPKSAWNTAALNQPRPAQSNEPNAEKPAWPTTQQAQFQAPRGPKAGQPTSTNFNPGYYPRGSKYAGKQQLASRGFDKPIQITRMEWGEPLPNAQDTWGDSEPVPQPLASAMQAEGKPSYRRPTAQVSAFPPKLESVPEIAPTSSNTSMASSAQPAFQNAPAKPAVSLQWTRMWTTDGLDHSGDEVRAFLHLASMPDLVDENGGAGWLITASNNLLNLWACTCIGSPGEPALQLVHSLDTDFAVADLQLDPANNLLMAAGRDSKAFTECVALHHLRLSPGIFRLKGRLGLPVGVSGKLAKNTGSVKALQVQSVHGHQGQLVGCCAASHDRTIAVYPANVTPGEVAKHKAVWKAHGRSVTVLHANPHCPALLSGDEAGCINIWNMKSKPSDPEAEVRHDKTVTGIFSISEKSFVSCSTDGRLCLWDLSQSRRPVYSVAAPEQRPIIRMAVSKDTSLVAFATPSGLYVVDMMARGPVQTVAVNEPRAPPSICIAWNTGSSGQTYLYASNGSTITAYRASSYQS